MMIDKEAKKMQYTAEIYKMDARCKKGEKLVAKVDYEDVTKEGVERSCKKNWPAPKFRFVIFDTFVTKKNLMSGEEFQERYDTPYYCSPSSESFWSM
jgi:hypothetical protein